LRKWRPNLPLGFHQRLIERASGIVDEDVQAAEPLDGEREKPSTTSVTH
jgi:hypothetical protein